MPATDRPKPDRQDPIEEEPEVPPHERTDRTHSEPNEKGEQSPPAGESPAANDENLDPDSDEETMPIEQGYSIVP